MVGGGRQLLGVAARGFRSLGAEYVETGKGWSRGRTRSPTYAVRQVGNVLGMCPVQMYSHPCRECPQMIVIPASHVTCGSRQEGVDCQALHGVRLSYLSYKNNSNGWDDGVTGSSPPSTTRSSRAVGVCSLSSTTAGWLGGGGVVVGWPQPLVRRSLSRGCHSDSTGSCRRSGSCC